jgi:hypothetical protein
MPHVRQRATEDGQVQRRRMWFVETYEDLTAYKFDYNL